MNSMKTTATLSEDRIYRYTLTREWDEALPTVAFIGLNPSTADENIDDPTIRRCIGFAKRWGYGRLLMLNLFAYRATKPSDLWAVHKTRRDLAVGELNHPKHLHEYLNQFNATLVIAAWGKCPVDQAACFLHVSQNLCFECLGKNIDGTPKHPLYIRGDMQPQPYNYSLASACS